MNKKSTIKESFNEAGSDIPFLNFLYLLSIPLSIVFIKLKFKPDTITTFSNISAFVSFYFILFENNFLLFSLLWLFALMLDICDGIVARKTKQQTPQGSFYDHFTDQIKIIFLFLSVGLYYDSLNIWILTFISSTLFLLYSLLSYMIKFRMKILIIHVAEDKRKKFSFKIKNRALIIFKRYFYNNIFMIQGNFVVYLSFLFLPELVIYVFSVLIFIISFNLIKSIKHMNNINNDLQKNNLKWS